MIFGFFSIAVGILTIISRYMQWGWFMDNPKVIFIDNILGDKWADVYHITGGLFFIILGILFIANVF
jgi:hypothetical protein